MSRGGQRYGAGRPGWRRKCEHKLAFDIRKVRHAGRLRPGSFSWAWWRDDEQIASVGVRVHEGTSFVSLSYRVGEDEPRSVTCTIPLEHTDCRFGGRRAYFLCPDCHRRCEIVYGISPGGGFSCRLCQRLGYASEAESVTDRCWRQIRKLEARVAEDGDKPKWMRWRTYNRICDRIEGVEGRKDAGLAEELAALFVRLGGSQEDDRS